MGSPGVGSCKPVLPDNDARTVNSFHPRPSRGRRRSWGVTEGHRPLVTCDNAPLGGSGGHVSRPFKAAARVRIPLGVPAEYAGSDTQKVRVTD